MEGGLISVRWDADADSRAVYALIQLCRGLGVQPDAQCGAPEVGVPTVYYGAGRPRTPGTHVLHIPADERVWQGGLTADVEPPAFRRVGRSDFRFDRDLLYPVYRCLTGEGVPRSRATDVTEGAVVLDPVLSRYFEAIAEALASLSETLGRPFVRVAPWPGGRLFCLWLSHDVDWIFHRGLYRLLSDINHARRVAFSGEPGHLYRCLARMARAVVAPKSPHTEFHRIRQIEGEHGWASTWFLLSGKQWARHGGRYRLDHPEVKRIVNYLRREGCEIGIHGGYYDFNSADRYRASARVFEHSLGFRPSGIRNHYLRWSYPETWRSQQTAGFAYDATLGYSDVPGFRAGTPFPFEVFAGGDSSSPPIIELPLAVMDVTLLRYQQLGEAGAVRACDALVDTVARTGGLLSALWHNNYFDTPEYQDWERVFISLLDSASSFQPWCATGGEITTWWRQRGEIVIQDDPAASGFYVESRHSMSDVAILVRQPYAWAPPQTNCVSATVERIQGGWRLVFPRLEPGRRIRVETFAASVVGPHGSPE